MINFRALGPAGCFLSRTTVSASTPPTTSGYFRYFTVCTKATSIKARVSALPYVGRSWSGTEGASGWSPSLAEEPPSFSFFPERPCFLRLLSERLLVHLVSESPGAHLRKKTRIAVGA